MYADLAQRCTAFGLSTICPKAWVEADYKCVAISYCPPKLDNVKLRIRAQQNVLLIVFVGFEWYFRLPCRTVLRYTSPSIFGYVNHEQTNLMDRTTSWSSVDQSEMKTPKQSNWRLHSTHRFVNMYHGQNSRCYNFESEKLNGIGLGGFNRHLMLSRKA